MNMFASSIKKSYRRTVWQMKDPKTHDAYALYGMQSVLDGVVASLGGEPSRNDQFYIFLYTDVAPTFPFQLRLKKKKDDSLNHEFRIVENSTGSTEGDFPIPTACFSQWKGLVDEVYISVSQQNDKQIYFASELRM